MRTCLGSGRVRNASRRVAGVKGAIGVVRHGMICLSLLKGKGMGKWMLQLGHLVGNRHKLQGMCRPTARRPQVVLPRGPPGAGVGSPPTPESSPSPPPEELVKALQLLQSILTPEDFSKYEKKLVPPKQQERVKLRERELLEAVERQANYEKQEQKHLEMIAKHEHNLAQQKAMLESVRSQLAEVRDTVGALRALVSETKEPPISSIVPPLPPPREPPPPLESCPLLAERKISCLLTLPIRRSILILIWKKRLGHPSQNQTRRGCLSLKARPLLFEERQ